MPARAATNVDFVLDAKYTRWNQHAGLALSRRGSLAVIFRDHGGDPEGKSKLLVVRADGTRVVLDLPAASQLRQALSIYAYDCKASMGRCPAPYFGDVRLAADGTPYVTAAYFYDGMYMGYDEAAFKWNGQMWRNPLPEHFATPHDIEVVGAENGRFVFNRTYASERPFGPFCAAHDGRAALTVNGVQEDLGPGTATGLRGGYISGFSLEPDSCQDAFDRSSPPAQRLAALQWNHGHPRKLGPGIARAVSASGDEVGSDSPVPNEFGHPTLWHADRTITLGAGRGTANAVADDGTIVGTMDDRAFIIRGGDSERRLTFLDDLVSDKAWHFLTALGIADRGRLLAVGRRGGGQLRIVLLDPIDVAVAVRH